MSAAQRLTVTLTKTEVELALSEIGARRSSHPDRLPMWLAGTTRTSSASMPAAAMR